MHKEFGLYDLSDEHLEEILKLSDKDMAEYTRSLIQKYYNHVITHNDKIMYNQLVTSYKSSFEVEKFYRDNLVFQNGFQAVYTKTGLIRNLVCDIYFSDDHLVTH